MPQTLYRRVGLAGPDDYPWNWNYPDYSGGLGPDDPSGAISDVAASVAGTVGRNTTGYAVASSLGPSYSEIASRETWFNANDPLLQQQSQQPFSLSGTTLLYGAGAVVLIIVIIAIAKR